MICFLQNSSNRLSIDGRCRWKNTDSRVYEALNKEVVYGDEGFNKNGVVDFPFFKGSSLSYFLQTHCKITEPMPFVSLDDYLANVDRYKNVFFVYVVSVHFCFSFGMNNLHLLDSRVLDMVRKKRCLLVLDGSYEGGSLSTIEDGYSENFLEIYKRKLDELMLPYTHVQFYTNGMNCQDEYDRWISENYGYDIGLKVNTMLYDLLNAERLFSKRDRKNRKIFVPYERSHMKLETVDYHKVVSRKVVNFAVKRFMRVNRTPRYERDLILGILHNCKMIDNSLISHAVLVNEEVRESHEYNINQIFAGDDRDNRNKREFFARCCDPARLSKILPLDIDSSDTENRKKYNGDLPYDDMAYHNSLFSLICTSFPDQEDMMHLTSSVFNPIYMMHPFIIVGHQHTLRHLRNHGFKTFGEWIDERYDEIEDYYERLYAVGVQVQKLCMMKDRDFRIMISEMKKILWHNHEHIKNNTDILAMYETAMDAKRIWEAEGKR